MLCTERVNMKLDELISQLAEIEEALKKIHPDLESDNEKVILARSTKLNEEVGELMEEVLLKLGLQRPEKYEGHDKSNIEKELGDVFNSLILLGLALGIDVKQAIVARVEEMHQKYVKTR